MKDEVTVIVDGKHVTMKDLVEGLRKCVPFLRESLGPKSKFMYRFLDKDVRRVMRSAVRRRFATQTDPSGKKWKPLGKWRTWQKKALGTYEKGTLRDTDKLKNSIRVQKPKIKDGMLDIEQIASCPYAWVHQPPKNPPQGSHKIEGGYSGLFFNELKDNARGGNLKIKSKLTGKEVNLNKQEPFKNVFVPTRAFLGFDKISYASLTRAENKTLKLILDDFTRTLQNKVYAGKFQVF